MSKLKINVSPKADVKNSWLQWNVSIVDEFDHVVWGIGGWWWPLGLIFNSPNRNASWYSKRLLRLKQVDKWKMPIHWYGLFSWRSY